MESEFKGVNKRLDGIDYELKKINTVIKNQEQYDNIFSQCLRNFLNYLNISTKISIH